MFSYNNIRNVLIVSGLLFVTLYALFANDDASKDKSAFGTLTVKGSDDDDDIFSSSYDEVKNKEEDPFKLQYKVQTSKQNPLISLYRKQEKETPKKPSSRKQTKRNKRNRKNTAGKGDFLNFSNEDNLGSYVYSAVFEKGQWAYPGRPLSIVLEEPIESINLKAGTVLRGIPTINGSRIHIKITAGVLGSIVRPLNLECLDKKDCVQGLYHDSLASKERNEVQKGVLDELWSLTEPDRESQYNRNPSTERELIKRGGKIAKRITERWSSNEQIFIERGRKVLVIIPNKQ